MTRRVLVVGAGVTGLLTAVRCAQAGHRVTVLDAGAIPNPGCTSFDQHRAIRALDPGDVAATRAAAVAHRRWLELESLLGTRFYRRVGVVTAWSDAQSVVDGATVPVSLVAPEKLPHIVFPAGTTGVLEADAGVLLADRVLHAATAWLRKHPSVTLRPGCRVLAVQDGRVELDGETLTGAVVVAAGPWSRDLVDLPTVLHRQTMVYLRPPSDLAHWWETAPSAGRIGADGQSWLLPPGDGTLLKISTAAVCREVSSLDGPDDEREWAQRVLAASILSDVDRYEVVGVKRCHYLADRSLARIGPALWACASGGDGFRMAPLVADQIEQDLKEEG